MLITISKTNLKQIMHISNLLVQTQPKQHQIYPNQKLSTTSNSFKPKTMAKKISLALTLKFKSFFPIQYKNYRY